VLGGSLAVPALDTGVSSTGGTTLTNPTSVLPGLYWQFACADYGKTVAESNELNNCTMSASQVQVLAPGMKFTLTDTVGNQGQGPAGASTTRYYLSTDTAWSAGDDVLLTGTRSVVALAPGAVSVGSKLVTVPLATPSGTYYALACADDLKKVAEGNSEGNNCTASAGTVVVAP